MPPTAAKPANISAQVPGSGTTPTLPGEPISPPAAATKAPFTPTADSTESVTPEAPAALSKLA